MVQLLRYQLFLSIGIIFLQIWRSSLNNMDAIKSWISSSSLGAILTPATIEVIIKYLPIHSIILLGIYALSSVLYKVATFNDCNDAAEELTVQIGLAKTKLKEAGFTF